MLIRTLFAAALGALLLAALPARAYQVTLVGPTQVTLGSTFSFDVLLTDAVGFEDELLAFGFDVTSANPSIAQFTGATVYAPFNDDSASFVSTMVAGSVFPGLTRGDGTSFLLARLTFQALAAGLTTLGITSDTLDLNEGLVYLLAGNQPLAATASIAIAPVPEPSAYVLLVAGLVVIGLVSRRRTRG